MKQAANSGNRALKSHSDVGAAINFAVTSRCVTSRQGEGPCHQQMGTYHHQAASHSLACRRRADNQGLKASSVRHQGTLAASLPYPCPCRAPCRVPTDIPFLASQRVAYHNQACRRAQGSRERGHLDSRVQVPHHRRMQGLACRLAPGPSWKACSLPWWGGQQGRQGRRRASWRSWRDPWQQRCLRPTDGHPSEHQGSTPGGSEARNQRTSKLGGGGFTAANKRRAIQRDLELTRQDLEDRTLGYADTHTHTLTSRPKSASRGPAAWKSPKSVGSWAGAGAYAG